jgi:secreted PhoX family phosphatase
MSFSRRTFLSTASVSTAFAGLAALAACSPKGKGPTFPISTDKYGPLKSDPEGVLDLPKGFEYRILSRMGDAMDDGLLLPADPDGMAAFATKDGETILMRNHEIAPGDLKRELPPSNQSISAFGRKDKYLDRVDATKLYDHGPKGRQLSGGVTAMVIDEGTMRVQSQFLALGGTYNNCAGGLTPWGSWITCEETIRKAKPSAGIYQDHGYAFEVVADPQSGLQKAVPLRDMGRFQHEAACVDPRSSIVYMTQDYGSKPSLLYRFLPNVPGKLAMGGKLQALAIMGSPTKDMRNWPSGKAETVDTGDWMYTEWVDLDDVTNPNNDLELRGLEAGAAIFTRGEGMWFGEDEMYFACTNGGAAKVGQIWRYVPSPVEGTALEARHPGRLQLFVESPDPSVMEYADNITIAPWGDLITCEDGKGDNFLRGITPDGRIYTLARSALKQHNEFCGACFGPDGKTLYFNLQQSGLTIAVRGPWDAQHS